MPAKKNTLAELTENEIEVTTKEGRTLVYRQITPWEFLKLNDVLGPKRSQNESIVGQAMLAAGIRKVNGSPRMFPHSEETLEACVNALGFDGLAALGPLAGQGKQAQAEVVAAAGESHPTK